MTEQRLEFVSSSGAVQPGSIQLLEVRGREALSTPYEYELLLESTEDGGLGPEILDELLRQPCHVRFGEDGGAEVHGILRSLRVLSTATGRDVAYRAHLVPTLWSLSRVVRSRVFQDLDVPGIVRSVLSELGMQEGQHFELRLYDVYPTSEYTVQYQESDLDFVARLCEHQGIFYFFEQLPDGERVVFADDNRAFVAHEGFGTLLYAPNEGGAGGTGTVRSLERTIEPQPAVVLLRDYNWRTPRVPLQSQSPADQVTGRGLLNRYGEHFKSPSDGDRLARIRAQELLAARDIALCVTDAIGLAPGHRFELSGHPLGELDRAYAIVSVETEIVGRARGDVHGLERTKRFRAIPYDTAYRPPCVTPRPRIAGLMHGHVDGEAPGTAAPIDELGRYRVLLPFDLVGQPGGKASRWIRLAQPASGPGFGIHFPLHVGVEVVIAHLDGDPDRPIIVASPPNTETVTPVHRDNATQSQIVTKTGIRLTWDDDIS